MYSKGLSIFFMAALLSGHCLNAATIKPKPSSTLQAMLVQEIVLRATVNTAEVILREGAVLGGTGDSYSLLLQLDDASDAMVYHSLLSSAAQSMFDISVGTTGKVSVLKMLGTYGPPQSN